MSSFGDVRYIGVLLDDHVPAVLGDDTLDLQEHMIPENDERFASSRAST
jgi:hypothetical protein